MSSDTALLSVSVQPQRTQPRTLRSASSRLDFVDGLRGVAVLLVYLYHVWMEGHAQWFHWWNPMRSGYAGVDLFLVLSGFCLYWPMVKDGAASREPTLIAFAKRRCRRILPPYYLAVLLFAGLALLVPRMGKAWPQILTPAEVARSLAWHVALLHNIRLEQVWTLASPFWTLALEFQLYIAMPILVIVSRRFGITRAVLLAAAVTLFYRFGIEHYLGGRRGWTDIGAAYGYVLAYSLPGKWLTFAMGMWAASLVANSKAQRIAFPWSLPAIACLAAAAFLVERLDKSHPASGQFDPLVDLLWALGFFFLVLCACKEPRGGGPFSIASLLRMAPLVWLGVISYSFYLLHEPLLKFVAENFHFAQLRWRFNLGISVAVVLPAIILLSFLFHLFVERPFMNAPAKPTVMRSAPPEPVAVLPGPETADVPPQAEPLVAPQAAS